MARSKAKPYVSWQVSSSYKQIHWSRGTHANVTLVMISEETLCDLEQVTPLSGPWSPRL